MDIGVSDSLQLNIKANQANQNNQDIIEDIITTIIPTSASVIDTGTIVKAP